jgi:hypothetical protein
MLYLLKLSSTDSFDESLNEETRFSDTAYYWTLDFGELECLKNKIRGLGINIHGTQIKEIIRRLYWRASCYCWSHKGFPYVEPNAKGKAIIWPIIDGAKAESLYVPHAIVHL